MEIFRKRKWLGLIILGILLRIVLAGFVYHTDIKGQYHEAQLLDYGVAQGYQRGVDETTPLHYPPPIYLLYNIYPKVGNLIFSDYFDDWMKDWSYSQVANHPKIFRDLLAMKVPLILFDLLVAFLLIKIVSSEKKGLALAVWLFNPFSLYAIYAFSQFDIIPTSLVLLSVFFWKRRKFNFSYLSLGLAAGVKVFPLLLLPYYLILDARNIKMRLVSAGIAIVSFIICLAPILTSPVALKSVFLSNLTSGVFQARIPLGSSMFLPIYVALYLFLLILIMFKAVAKPSIESAIFLVLGTLLGLSSFNPQWMIWVMPFLLMLSCEAKIGWKETLGMMLSYVGVVLLINDSFVSVGLFRAVNNTFATLPSLRSFLDRVGVGEQLQGVANALLSAFVLLINLEILKKISVPFKPLGSKPKIMQILILWIVGLISIFFLAHIPLTIFGRYLDTNHMVEQSRISLSDGTKVSQRIFVDNPNFFQIQIRLKNVGRKNNQIHAFSLSDDRGNLLKRFDIGGLAIGDDFDLDLTFPSIADSQGKHFILEIQAPKEVGTGTEIILPYNKDANDGWLSVNGQVIPGKLAYYTYYKVGGYWSNVGYTLNNLFQKL